MSQSHIHSHPLAVAIIEATAKLIAEVGIGGATVRNIAKHADVLPPQIYKHIGN
ncbi:helix-turn-helix domain-containing protein, partial [Pseudomonas sp. YQ_5]|uniref:helix-turn-helix domain-containing protein n=1 Tax=Pseudomonas sp. YQ_5 TaxID=3367229 RepID=UPI003709FA65